MTVRGAIDWGGAEGAGRPVDILVVDDDPMNQALLGDVCEAFGWSTRSVARGDQVLSALKTKKPDLVLLDLMLPGLDGFAVLEQLRADSDLAGLPVVVVSAISDDSAVWRAGILGVSRYLVKPISLDELRGAVHEVLAVSDGPALSGQAASAQASLRASVERFLGDADPGTHLTVMVLGFLVDSGVVADEAARILLQDFPRPQWLFRLGGSKLGVVMPSSEEQDAMLLFERLERDLEQLPAARAGMAAGASSLVSGGQTDAQEVLDKALEALQAALRKGGGLEFAS